MSGDDREEEWKRTVEFWKADIFENNSTLFEKLYRCNACGEQDVLSSDGGYFMEYFQFLCESCYQQHPTDDKSTSLSAYTRFFKAHLKKLTALGDVYKCEYPECEDSGSFLVECPGYHLHGYNESQAKLQNLLALWRNFKLPASQTADCNVCREAKACKLCSKTEHFDHSCEPDKAWVRSSINQVLSAHINMLDDIFDVNTQPAAFDELMETQPERVDETRIDAIRSSIIKDHLKYITDLRRIANHLILFIFIDRPRFCEYLEVFQSLYNHLQKVHKYTLPEYPTPVRSGWLTRKIILKCFLPFTQEVRDNSKYLLDGPQTDAVRNCKYDSFDRIIAASCYNAGYLIPVHSGGIGYSWMNLEGDDIAWHPQKKTLNKFAKKYLGEEVGFWETVKRELARHHFCAIQELAPNCWVATDNHRLCLITVDGMGRILRVQTIMEADFSSNFEVIHKGVNNCVVYALTVLERKTEDEHPAVLCLEFRAENGFAVYSTILLESHLEFNAFDTIATYEANNELRFCLSRTEYKLGCLEEFVRDIHSQQYAEHYKSTTIVHLTFAYPKILTGSANGMCLLADMNIGPSRLFYVDMPMLFSEEALVMDRDELKLPYRILSGDFIDAYLRRFEELWELVTLFHDDRKDIASVYVFNISSPAVVSSTSSPST